MEKILKTKKNRQYQAAKDVKLVFSGNDYFERLEKIIKEVRHELHIQTYIFDHDETGKAIIELLKEAAARKVNVYVLLDGFGASGFPKKLIRELRTAGIHIRMFAPFFSFNTIYLGRRLHHKVVVADHKVALIGGINIADKYHGNEDQLPWLDYAVEIHGNNCSGIHEFCNNIYHKNSSRRIYYPDKAEESGNYPIRFAINDWVNKRNEISHDYLQAIQKAKKEIIIVGGYFLPGRRMRAALQEAANRGVKVQIIVAGISDVIWVAGATRFFYSFLLRNNIELFEWRKSILHGKAAVIDREWSTIGSFNLNHLSAYASIEMNVEIESKQFSENFATHLSTVMDKCKTITKLKHERKNCWRVQFLNWCSFRVIRLLSFILTVFSYHRWFRRLFLNPKKLNDPV